MRLALAGDTMLGRKAGEALRSGPPASLVSPGVVEAAREADAFVLNLECCIAEGGRRWPDPAKPFFFRAPPGPAVELLVHLGVDCVTLANNHALDYGEDALLETFGHLDAAGIRWVGAGPDVERARSPATLETGGLRLAVIGVTDHPGDYAAGPGRPGVAWDPLDGLPEWLRGAIASADSDAVLVSPHWGPNMTSEPVREVRAAARDLVDAGATLVAGHSAHVFHGVAGRVLYDLGDFLDDYAVDPVLRNDVGMLFLVDLDAGGPRRLEAVPLTLDFCHTRLATPADAAWARERFVAACARLGTEAREERGRLVVEWP